MKNTISILAVFLLGSFNLNAQQKPFGELKNSFISSASGISKGGGFIVKSSIAEPIVGLSSNKNTTFEINTGYLRENSDLIFVNGF